MPRTTLDRELQALHELLLAIATLVISSLQQFLLVLETGDQRTLDGIIALAPTIDSLSMEAEERTLRLLILQQPLGGQDLRFLTSALHIEMDLKRAGTLPVEMAQLIRAQLLSPESTLSQMRTQKISLPAEMISALDEYGYVTEIFVLRGLLDLGKAVQHLLQETMQALAQKSVTQSEAVCQECMFMEQRYQYLSQDLMMMLWKAPALSALQRDASILQRIAQLLWIAHEMKQLARYAESICTHIVFIVRGKN